MPLQQSNGALVLPVKSNLAGRLGLEPKRMVLETIMLPITSSTQFGRKTKKTIISMASFLYITSNFATFRRR